MKNFIIQFLPIVLLFLFLSKNDNFIEFSKTTFGKLAAVFIIIFYVHVDKIIGLFVCAVVLLYYHTLNCNMHFRESMEVIDIENTGIDVSANDDYVDDYVYIDEDESKMKTILNPKENKKKLKRYVDYSYDGSEEDKFRKNNCDNGQLLYKDLKIKNEMAEHVYPELKYKNKVCNPCNKYCDISITKNKIETEEKIKPVYSKTLFIF